MKRPILKFLCCSLLFVGLNCSSADGERLAFPDPEETEKPEDPEDPEETERSIAAFFENRLAGGSGLYDASTKIRLSEIAVSRKTVWDVWKRANRSLSEEKLATLGDLSSVVAASWTLPPALEADAVMPYYWGAKGAKPADGYPLFLYLHGSGSKTTEWSTGLSLCKRFDDAPSAFFIPQIPNGDPSLNKWWQKAKLFAWERLFRQALLSDEIDPNRIHIFGISEGGYGSQRLASFYADYLAGAGPMAGGEPLKNAPAENCANIAFSFRTGAADAAFFRSKLTSYTKEAFDALAEAHPGYYEHRIELIPGAGHQIDYTQTTPYLKAFERNPWPRYVCWEDFSMDGVSRRGFYNLLVLERPNGTSDMRRYYEMKIEGNEVVLTVADVRYTTTEKESYGGYPIETRFGRTYVPASAGRFIVYLNESLVDLSLPVTLKVNGKTVFAGPLDAELKHMVNSCAAFFDPERIYPAAIEVDLSRL